MIKILPADKNILMILGFQKIIEGVEYRPLKYLHIVEIDRGYLAYNFLTKEMIFLEKLDFSDNYLVEKYFSVPVNYEEDKLVISLREVLRTMYNYNGLDYFKIMTTTDCNARCFYCFEKDLKRFDMTEQTALDIADFIVKKSASKVKISWFGGEPLFNEKAIDIISQKLIDNNINFSSDMITNGYLFNCDNIKKSISLWQLKKVQITLDGTEKIYNRIKNYIYINVNAYKTVLNNIEQLLIAGIKVTVRLNMDLYNAEDLFELIEILAERFGEYNEFDCYVQPLFEGCGSHVNGRSLDARALVNKKYYELYEHAKKLSIYRKSEISSKMKVFACAADSPNAIAIYPDGKLWKCDHYAKNEDIGDIYNNNYNTTVIDSWKKLRYYYDCGGCKFFPECLIPEKCLQILPGCYDSDRFVKTKMLEDTMLRIYHKRKRKI